MSKLHLEKKIERYLSGQMQDSELTEFEEQLVNNSDLARQVEFFMLLREHTTNKYAEAQNAFIQHTYRKPLTKDQEQTFLDYNNDPLFIEKKQIFNNLQQALNTNKGLTVTRNHFLRKVAAVAAVVVFLVVSGITLQYIMEKPIEKASLQTAERLNEQSSEVENLHSAEGTIAPHTDEEFDENENNNDSFVQTEQVADLNNNPPHTSSIKSLVQQYVKIKLSDKDSNLTLMAYAESQEYALPLAYVENEALGMKTEFIPRSGGVVVISPEDLEILSNPVTFEWQADQLPSEIIVKNNKNEEVWKTTITNTNKIVCDKELVTGTYYWFLKIDNKLHSVKQFFIIQTVD